jgi:hypothetical protein
LKRLSGLVAVAACAILVMALLAACGGSDSKATSTTGTASGSGATVGATTTVATPTSATAGASATTPAKVATATTGSTGAATATTAAPDIATATTAAEETPTEASADVSPTDASDSSDDPLEDVKSIDPNDLPNFTLTFSLDAAGMGTDPDAAAESKFSMNVEQSAVDNYHLKIVSADPTSEDQTIETWLVDGKQYADMGTGEVTELPEGTDAFFTPATFLQQVPEVTDTPSFKKQGEEEVNGRKTTHYRLDGKDIEDFFTSTGDETMKGATDGAGAFDVWIDNDLKIQIKSHSDLTWKNADGTPGFMNYEYEINQIGSTAKVSAPQ